MNPPHRHKARRVLDSDTMPRDLKLTRDEGEKLIELLEGRKSAAGPLNWQRALAMDIRYIFGMETPNSPPVS